MRYSPGVKQETRRLKKLEQATREHLLQQMGKWMKVVPRLKDVTWLGDFESVWMKMRVMTGA